MEPTTRPLVKINFVDEKPPEKEQEKPGTVLPKKSKDKNLKIFQAIAEFIKSLDSVYGEKYKSLSLYNHLIGKTTFNDTFAINKHITNTNSNTWERSVILFVNFSLSNLTLFQERVFVHVNIQPIDGSNRNYIVR